MATPQITSVPFVWRPSNTISLTIVVRDRREEGLTLLWVLSSFEDQRQDENNGSIPTLALYVKPTKRHTLLREIDEKALEQYGIDYVVATA